MLNLFRKIFGCWVEKPEIINSKLEPINEHETIVNYTVEPTPESLCVIAKPTGYIVSIGKTKETLEHDYNAAIKTDMDKKNEIVSNIISAVIIEKEKGFISWNEQAMSDVTDNKFAFLKYRNIK